VQIDLNSVTTGQAFQSHICIVGGGVAGLVLATQFRDSGLTVHVLEAGGLKFEAKSQELYTAMMAGQPHSGTHNGRFRVLGGSSTQWGGQLLPYTDDVFDPPSSLGLPSWPITGQELAPYYEKLQALLGAGDRPFTTELLHGFHQKEPFPAGDVRLRYSKWLPFNKRNLGRSLGRTCLESPRTTVFLNATATSLEISENHRFLRSASVKNAFGNCYVFQASVFVLCAGTIECPRLLLASRNSGTQSVGNDHDQVGRYFHDHLSVEAALLPTETRAKVLKHFTPRFSNGTLYTPKLEASADLRSKRKLLSVMAHFPIEEPRDSGLAHLRDVLKQMQSRQLSRNNCQTLLRLPLAFVHASRLLFDTQCRQKRPVSSKAKIKLHIDTEQRPQAESRIRLSNNLDSLGMPRAEIDWRISNDERFTVATYAGVLSNLFKKEGWGDLQWHPELFENDGSWLRFAKDTYHMMGGTRMGTNPTNSVVDRDLQVHGVDNLYISSCSVFPTGGSSNPTFTLIALTLRLADTLKRRGIN
jgi:choline dehydrogenase-like flavoprotein